MAIVRSASEADYTFRVQDLEEELRVLRFSGREEISRPFRFEVDFACEEADLALDQVLGKRAVLTLHGENGERYVHGVLTSFVQTSVQERYALHRAELVPDLALLGMRRNLRIFQEKTVEEIVGQVLDEAGFPGDSYRFSLEGDHPVREYCVQYRESDLDFISRLLEEEGVFYFFEHDEEKHVLVMADDTAAMQPLEDPAALRYRTPSGLVPEDEHVYDYRHRGEVRPGAVTLRDYNFTNPAMNLQAESRARSETALETYDYPGRYVDARVGSGLAEVRLEELRALKKQGRGRSTCKRFLPGFRFSLEEHPRHDFNGEFLLLEVSHRGTQPQSLDEGAGTQGGEGPQYENRFLCVPSDTPFRPERRTRPAFVDGPQTARVVGPSGEEIYPDEHGRVKVQFHWDRQGQFDEASSCWVRVSQGWAGGGYGNMFLPRVGQEVIVDFLEGDPDRPLITGRVYNADHAPPYGLPDSKAQSVIKTKTYTGEGANEIRFEDNAGSEQFYLHAQKDMDLRVLNNASRTVDAERHLKVAKASLEKLGSRDLTVDEDETVKVGGEDPETGAKAGDLSVTVEQDVLEAFNQNHRQEVAQAYELEATTIVVQPGSELTLKAGGSFLKIDSSGITIKGTQVKINEGGSPGAAGVRATAVAPAHPKGVEKAVSGRDMTYTVAAPVSVSTVKPLPAAWVEREENHWIEYEVTDASGQPIGGIPYELQLTDGSIERGTLPEDGRLRRDGIPEGTCRLQLAELEALTWSKASAGIGEEVSLLVMTSGFEQGTEVQLQIYRLYRERDTEAIDRLSAVLDEAGQAGVTWRYQPTEGDPEEVPLIFKGQVGSIWKKSEALVLERRVLSAAWSQTQAYDGDTVTLVAELRGVPDGVEARFRVFEKDWMTDDDEVLDFQPEPVQVQNNRIEAAWMARWQPDDEKTGSDVCLEYYFVVEIEELVGYSNLLNVWPVLDAVLIGDDGNPLQNAAYTVVLGDGSRRRGTTDAQGRVREQGVKGATATVIHQADADGNAVVIQDWTPPEEEAGDEPVLDDDGPLLDEDGNVIDEGLGGQPAEG